MIIIVILSLACAIASFSYAMKYLYLYRNLRKNFKSFLKFVDTKYILKNDVTLINATIEALEQAREKNNTFEIKTYTKLLERLREGD